MIVAFLLLKASEPCRYCRAVSASTPTTATALNATATVDLSTTATVIATAADSAALLLSWS